MLRDKFIEIPRLPLITLTLMVLFLVSGCKKEDEENQSENFTNQRLIVLPEVQTIDFTMESAAIKIFNNSNAVINCEIEYDYNLLRLQYPGSNNIAPGESVEITATPKWKNITNSETIVNIIYRINSLKAYQSKIIIQKQTYKHIELDYNIVFAEYAGWLDKIIAISTIPKNALLIIDPESGNKTEILLSNEPLILRITPKLKKAAVGYDGFFSIIDLESNLITHHQSFPKKITGIVLGSENWAYATGWNSSYMYNIHLPDDSITLNNYPTNSSLALKAHPENDFFYAVDRNIWPASLYKFDVSDGLAVELYEANIPYPISAGHNFWFTDDSQYLVTAGGQLLSLSDYPDNDLKFLKLIGLEEKEIIEGVHCSSLNTLYIVTREDNHIIKDEYYIELIDDEYFNYYGKYHVYNVIPDINSSDEYVVAPTHIFANQASSKLYLIMHRDDDEFEDKFFLFSFDI